MALRAEVFAAFLPNNNGDRRYLFQEHARKRSIALIWWTVAGIATPGWAAREKLDCAIAGETTGEAEKVYSFSMFLSGRLKSMTTTPASAEMIASIRKNWPACMLLQKLPRYPASKPP